jgi:acyl carrier protein
METNGRNYLAETQRILADQLGLDLSDVTPEKTLFDLGADSLDDVELIMAYQEEYDIEIPDEDAEKLRDVATIAAYVAHRLSPSNAEVRDRSGSGTPKQNQTL